MLVLMSLAPAAVTVFVATSGHPLDGRMSEGLWLFGMAEDGEVGKVNGGWGGSWGGGELEGGLLIEEELGFSRQVRTVYNRRS